MENMEAVQNTQGVEAGQSATAEEKVFTQAELNEVVQKRLAREREKMSLLAGGEYEQKLLEREKAVTEKEYRAVARERLGAAKLPAGAADFLDCSSEEAFEADYAKMAKLLGPMLEEMVEARVEERFRQSGYTPAKGGHAGDPVKDAVRTAFSKRGV